jgi:hypothetical protein
MTEALALGDVLAHRMWLRRERPFPHIVARDVFEPAFYGALESHVRQILQDRIIQSSAGDRSIPGYDAYGIGFDESLPDPLGVFLSNDVRDMLCGLFDVEPTPYVFAGIHHHASGSQDGFVHSDYNPVWFPRAPNGRVRCPDQEVCAYKTGEGSLPAAAKVEVVRAVALIFFLLNGGWRSGDGGETGLFADRGASVREPVLRCPPENNSLVMFECTPESFHAFLGGNRRPRTSVIMWVHRAREDAVATYGEDRLERWQS